MTQTTRTSLIIGATVAALGVATVATMPHKPAVPVAVATSPSYAAYLPNPTLTPGAVDSSLTTSVICAKGWSTKSVRNVPESEKQAVYKEYGMVAGQGTCPCEVDHRVPLCLGGSNDIRNLWVQTYQGDFSAHWKDRLEVEVNHEVCGGKISLKDAQAIFLGDWTAGYRQRFGTEGPKSDIPHASSPGD